MARLQGFPDDYEIAGAWVTCIKQLGNAVPVQVGEKFGRAIKNILNKAERQKAHGKALKRRTR